MHNTLIYRLLVLALLVCISLTASAQPNAAAGAGDGVEKRPPNVLLIMADDMGYECVTANGGQSYQTPRLDALAANGIRFTNGHSQPICTPSRVQLMTGIYNNRNYIRFGHLDPEAKTFAHLFRDAGYATVIAGKWQLEGGLDQPKHFGFDEYCLWQLTRAGQNRVPRYANPGLEINGEVVDFTGGKYGPDLVSDYLCDFFERNIDKPFFAYYPMILPHWPFQPTPDSEAWNPDESREYPRKEWRDEWFADMVAYTDKMVGKLVDKLDELGQLDNTIIIFLGDNGTDVSITSRFDGRDYRGGKGTTTDNATHVPMIVHWPAAIDTGRVSESLLDFSDFLPTLADAAGIAVPGEWAVDGVSFADELRGGAASPRQYIYCYYSVNGARRPAIQYTRTAHHKLYADGRFFDTAADFEEQRPLEVDALNEEQRAAYTLLRAALDKHRAVTAEHDAIINAKREQHRQ